MSSEKEAAYWLNQLQQKFTNTKEITMIKTSLKYQLKDRRDISSLSHLISKMVCSVSGKESTVLLGLQAIK